MSLELHWMRPEAPYMPVATVGLLSVLDDDGEHATASWEGTGPNATLVIATRRSAEEVAECIVNAPWPDLDEIRWGNYKVGQALKPTLAELLKRDDARSPVEEFRRLVKESPETEARLLRAILCDGALDADGSPLRSRLLRGVKSDLSSVRNRPKRIKAEQIARELTDGPDFVRGSSGLGLGLVPEVHTFGGTTGPDASTVGAYSALLFLLLWHGIMALPPVAVARGRSRTVGGPMVTEPDVLSWPRWRCTLDLPSLKTMLSLPAIHAERPDVDLLAQRGIDAVFRARAEPINSMVAVFRWGDRVA
mgnify:CR=1 FL=1